MSLSIRDVGADEIEVIHFSQGLQQLGLGTYQIGVGVKKGRRGRGRRRGGAENTQSTRGVCVGWFVRVCGCVWVSGWDCVG